jgi:hypothetical protein
MTQKTVAISEADYAKLEKIRIRLGLRALSKTLSTLIEEKYLTLNGGETLESE